MTIADRRADVALTRVRLQATAGASLDTDDLPDDVARAVRVADRVGAPLVPTLDAAADARCLQQRLDADVRSATAPARTVAAGLVALPVLVVPAMGRLLDVDLVAFYATSVGVVVGAVALGLWVCGGLAIVALVRRTGRPPAVTGPWARTLALGLLGSVLGGPVLGGAAAVVAHVTHRPRPSPPHPDLADACELLAAVLQSGVPVAPGLREIAGELPTLTASLRRLALLVELGRLGTPADAPDPLAPLADTLVHAARSGGAVVPALRSQAARLRDARGADAHEQAQRLPALLVFPTALLLLPASVLLIGAPIVATGLSGIGGT